MVQILPPKTNLGTQIGQAAGAGLSSGIQKGSEVGFQRGLLQKALSGIENLPPNTTPFQLASRLMQATAGIPGAERYVGQLYPLLLDQLRNQAAFSDEGGMTGVSKFEDPNLQSSQQNILQPAKTIQNPQGQTDQQANQQSETAIPKEQNVNPAQPYSTQEVAKGKSPKGGGLLGNYIPQDEIDRQATAYAKRTLTGHQGYQQAQQHFKEKNALVEKQRNAVEEKARGLGVTDEEIPLFMRLAQRQTGAKNFDEAVTDTLREFKEYKNLTKSLDKVSYPGFFSHVTGQRQEKLDRLQNTAKRMIQLGFEPELRSKLEEEGLSPTEVEEVIRPPSFKTRQDFKNLPQSTGYENDKSLENKYKSVVGFLKNNINEESSLLSLRQNLWQEKGYNWDVLAKAFKEATEGRTLSPSQMNEMNILETEPPRQSMSYIFQDWGNFLKTALGQK